MRAPRGARAKVVSTPVLHRPFFFRPFFSACPFFCIDPSRVSTPCCSDPFFVSTPLCLNPFLRRPFFVSTPSCIDPFFYVSPPFCVENIENGGRWNPATTNRKYRICSAKKWWVLRRNRIRFWRRFCSEIGRFRV